MKTVVYREFADIGLTPVGSLENTATVIGDILGVTFEKDKEGMYEEFPAFLASTPNLKYALLGTPLPEDDLRDAPSDEFNLLVTPVDDDSDHPEIDISEQLISQLMKKANIQCWKLS
ncbi:hypothetical protein [Pseudomonas chlororaphis]|uniref:hypothetical protein n=1 Tax=Pseudomonas chlororaphis TaxID=587753 RepID=UPI0015DFD908|nr:hypothetical protein [Pseudomonas chlororaphis]QLL13730.1 hypothetical protein H0I86_01160 [Pseudomonas chlororaphis subsp. aurantiaca]